MLFLSDFQWLGSGKVHSTFCRSRVTSSAGTPAMNELKFFARAILPLCRYCRGYDGEVLPGDSEYGNAHASGFIDGKLRRLIDQSDSCSLGAWLNMQTNLETGV
jgi:hypothetical protein